MVITFGWTWLNKSAKISPQQYKMIIHDHRNLLISFNNNHSLFLSRVRKSESCTGTCRISNYTLKFTFFLKLLFLTKKWFQTFHCKGKHKFTKLGFYKNVPRKRLFHPKFQCVLTVWNNINQRCFLFFLKRVFTEMFLCKCKN